MDGVEDEGQRGRQEMMRRRESRELELEQGVELEVEQAELAEERELEKKRNPCIFSEMFSWNIGGARRIQVQQRKEKASSHHYQAGVDFNSAQCAHCTVGSPCVRKSPVYATGA